MIELINGLWSINCWIENIHGKANRWYDDLDQRGLGTTRFLLFLVPAALLLFVFPVTAFYVFDLPVIIGQLIGVLVVLPALLFRATWIHGGRELWGKFPSKYQK
jgi:hypothetical protein